MIRVIISFLISVIMLPHAMASTTDVENGQYTVAVAEYRLPPSIDPDVLPDTPTEIWAKVFYPSAINQMHVKMPLVIFLHGNHPTCGTGSNPRIDMSCTYTETGSCPAGYVVTPNHAGYDYIGKHLASWGILVVSINANRGITCGAGREDDAGLNLARGKLILRHLSLLHEWSTHGGLPASVGIGSDGLVNKIDFGSIGLMGHSRGGEGVRAAYNLYQDKDSRWPSKIPDLNIKAIFEIGAVDGQTSRILDANGIVWNQLLPLCDGDVSTLQGRYPFERMLKNQDESQIAQKSLYEVWGANHNFFNTEWQTSDANGCDVGSPLFDPSASGSLEQQKIALISISAFFKAHLLTDQYADMNKLLNPLFPQPDSISHTTQVDRDFTTSPGMAEALHLQEFDSNSKQAKEIKLSQLQLEYVMLDKHLSTQAAKITWQHAGIHTYLETPLNDDSSSVNLMPFATLDFRVTRTESHLNSDETTNFSIQLADAHGHVSAPVSIARYIYLNRSGTYIRLLRSVRIPLTAFCGVDLTQIKFIRLIFDQTEQGELLISQMRAHHHLGIGIDTMSHLKVDSPTAIRTNKMRADIVTVIPAKFNKIIKITSPTKPRSTLHSQDRVEITFASEVPYPVTDSLPALTIANQTFTLSRYADMETLKELTFSIPVSRYQQLNQNNQATIKVGNRIWQFGQLKK